MGSHDHYCTCFCIAVERDNVTARVPMNGSRTSNPADRDGFDEDENDGMIIECTVVVHVILDCTTRFLISLFNFTLITVFSIQLCVAVTVVATEV